MLNVKYSGIHIFVLVQIVSISSPIMCLKWSYAFRMQRIMSIASVFAHVSSALILWFSIVKRRSDNMIVMISWLLSLQIQNHRPSIQHVQMTSYYTQIMTSLLNYHPLSGNLPPQIMPNLLVYTVQAFLPTRFSPLVVLSSVIQPRMPQGWMQVVFLMWLLLVSKFCTCWDLLVNELLWLLSEFL